MLGHYFATALMHFRRYKATTLINIACLAIGLICFLAAHWVVRSMASADRYFPGSERMYVITQKVNAATTDAFIPTMPITAWMAGPRIRTDIPELEAVARSSLGEELPIKAGDTKTFVQVKYVDPEFLDVFALSFIAGDNRAALRQPHSAVVTEPTAIRLFGSVGAALGSRFLLQSKHDLLITGVIKPVASPSHMERSSPNASLHFDVLVSMDVFEARARDDSVADATMKQWNIPTTLTYVVLPRDKSVDPTSLLTRLNGFGARHIAEAAGRYDFGAVPLSHLGLTFLNIVFGTEKTGVPSVTVIYLLAGLVLLISCLNYANLATAQAIARAKEIGMRRVVGAHRRQIVAQHLFEAGLQSLASVLLAGILIALILRALNQPGTPFVVGLFLSSPAFWLFLPALWLGVTLAAGAYPALVLARIPPVQAVRGSRASAGGGRAPALLAGAQFGMASFLLIAILVMENQNRELTQTALGSGTPPVVVLPGNPQAAGVGFDVLRSALLARPHIESVTGSVMPPWSRSTAIARVSASADQQSRRWTVCYHMVNYDFFDTLGIRLLAGRAFDRSHASDVYGSARVSNVVIDRALAVQFGWNHPQAAIGKTFQGWPADGAVEQGMLLQVIGVAETRPLALIGVGATSSMYALIPSAANVPSIRVSPANIPAALKEIDSVWEQLAPNVPLKRRFADEIWNEAYEPFRNVVGGFTFVAVLAFVNAVLGLIGMSLHAIGRRTQEIGIRKTLGASGVRVFAVLLRDASKPALIANIVVWPLAFVAAQGYLSLFTTRVSLSLVPFAAGLGITLLVAWAAVAIQAIRAASLNPSNVLRYE